MSFQFLNLRTIDGNLKLCGVALTYLLFLNSLYGLFLGLLNISNRHQFRNNLMVTTVSFSFQNLRTIPLIIGGDLKYCGVTLTCLEMISLNV